MMEFAAKNKTRMASNFSYFIDALKNLHHLFITYFSRIDRINNESNVTIHVDPAVIPLALMLLVMVRMASGLY